MTKREIVGWFFACAMAGCFLCCVAGCKKDTRPYERDQREPSITVHRVAGSCVALYTSSYHNATMVVIPCPEVP